MELENEVWCVQCHAMYGKIFRKQVNDTVWEHITDPSPIPKYCGVCERPTERKPT